MNNNLEQHKRSDKAKWAFTAIAFILVFVMLGGLIAAVVTETNPADWIQALKDRTETEGETPEGETTDDGGLSVTVDEEANAEVIESQQGIVLQTIRLQSSGVETVNSTYQKSVSATVYPTYTTDKSVDWSVEFVNPSSTWATGKTVTDYVTVSPVSDGSTEAVITCHKSFGEQIKVIVTSRVNTSASASCFVDFEKKISYNTTIYNGYLGGREDASASAYIIGSGSSYIDLDNINSAGGLFVPADRNAVELVNKNSFSVELGYSDYTVDKDISSLSYYSVGLSEYYFVTVSISKNFAEALVSAGINCTVPSFDFQVSTQSASLLSKDIVAAMIDDADFPVYQVGGENATKFNIAAAEVANNSDPVDFRITLEVRKNDQTLSIRYDFKFDKTDSYLSVSNLTVSDTSVIF